MDAWVWILVIAYLLIGFTKTTKRVQSGMRGTSLIGTYIAGTLLWPIL